MRGIEKKDKVKDKSNTYIYLKLHFKFTLYVFDNLSSILNDVIREREREGERERVRERGERWSCQGKTS